jgi:hypothetical protein
MKMPVMYGRSFIKMDADQLLKKARVSAAKRTKEDWFQLLVEAEILDRDGNFHKDHFKGKENGKEN